MCYPSLSPGLLRPYFIVLARRTKWGRLMRRFAIFSSFFALLSAPAALRAQGTPTQKPKTDDPSLLLVHAVRHQIQVLPFYSVFDYISYTLEGTKVTLTGQVLRRTLREQAEAAIKDLDGVTIVVDHIEVLPASSSDDALRDRVYGAIFEDQILQRYAVADVPPIHIIIKSARVTLEGSVDSLSDKSHATALAHSVPDVVSVTNDLAVHPPETGERRLSEGAMK
jgi:hyperosmotically inducible periplasmic protein